MTEESTRTNIFLWKLSLFLALAENGRMGDMLVKPKDDYNNVELMEGLLKGDLQVLHFIRNKTFPALQCLVNQGKGTGQDAEMTFHNAMVVVFKKLSKAPLQLECRFTTYFLGVCKVIWKFRHSTNHLPCDMPDLIDEAEGLEELYRESLEYRLYRKHFTNLKEKQKALFRATLTGKPYSELFAEFGYKSADVFKTEISRIKKRLIRNIKADPGYNRCNGKKNWSL